MTWVTLIIAGIITFLLRFSMIALIKENSLSEKTKIVLSYVPSAVFPAIIFPAIFLDNSGLLDLENNPKILASIIAIIAGFMSKNIIATIFAGLASYWFLIFVYY
ncbi:MAG: branched-chain amino acid transporter [Pelagibacteraceae bacterium BACL20 MAG-120920-bin64]|jgi:branched-subunit amino acid transport protein|uniref:AzlD domain-containing protein n=1 Tax=Candidatus Pelagibacter sp. TaxID=2024849 RepID=UPI000714704C|nr:MAG: branched-chain amino acid transporter [Pelagibacteraceae bacterium BACL20 MAG-120920-bin64]|tara:strand:+ start:252 stop:566 length:315 start_codon:yes stop_codon:yes gene_type:complete